MQPGSGSLQGSPHSPKHRRNRRGDKTFKVFSIISLYLRSVPRYDFHISHAPPIDGAFSRNSTRATAWRSQSGAALRRAPRALGPCHHCTAPSSSWSWRGSPIRPQRRGQGPREMRPAHCSTPHRWYHSRPPVQHHLPGARYGGNSAPRACHHRICPRSAPPAHQSACLAHTVQAIPPQCRHVSQR